MLDDTHARCVGVLEGLDRSALLAVARVGQGVEVGGGRDRVPLQAHRQTRAVHHLEHLLHAHVFFAAAEVAYAVAVVTEVEHGGGRTVDAQLVLQAGRDHVVVLARAAVFVYDVARDYEQRDALGAFGGSFHAREQKVDDVLGKVMVAARYPALATLDQVAVAVDVGGRGRYGTHVAARVRFGQAHGAAVAPAGHALYETCLVVVGAEVLDQLHGTVSEPGVHRKRNVGAHLQLAQHAQHRHRPLETAGLQRHREVGQAEFPELLPGLLVTVGGGDHAVLERAALAVARRIDRAQHFIAQPEGLLHHLVAVFATHVLVVLVLEQFLGPEVFV